MDCCCCKTFFLGCCRYLIYNYYCFLFHNKQYIFSGFVYDVKKFTLGKDELSRHKIPLSSVDRIKIFLFSPTFLLSPFFFCHISSPKNVFVNRRLQYRSNSLAGFFLIEFLRMRQTQTRKMHCDWYKFEN